MGVKRALVLAALTGACACSGAGSQTGTCGDMWFARNPIYKAAGYCFKTSRAIQVFGNAGRQYDDARDVPLSFRDRQHVGRIVRDEAAMGCRD